MSAAPLPPGRRQFIDIDGKPLVAGTVGYYIPSTLDPKDTWEDYDQQALNDNPLTLDARGQAAVWGNGRYREVVKDEDGNLIWDQETLALSSQSYEVGFYFVDEPIANDIIAVWNFAQAANFPTNFAGSVGSVNANPLSDLSFTIKLNGSSIGAMAVTSLGVVTFTTNVSSPAFAIGDRLTVVAPADAFGCNGVAATLLGSIPQ